MATVAHDLIQEITAAAAALGPKIEGYRDYLGTNVEAGRQPVSQALVDGERRQRKIDIVLNAVNDLLADGYPDVPTYTLTPGQYSDLRSQADTILAALASFVSSEPAVAAAINFGQATTKP